jgi:hypothetical protein
MKKQTIIYFIVFLICMIFVNGATEIGNNNDLTRGDYAIIVTKIGSENLSSGDVVGYSFSTGASKILSNKTIYSVISGKGATFTGNTALIVGRVAQQQGNTTFYVNEIKSDYTNSNYTGISMSGITIVKVNGVCVAGDWVIAIDNSGYRICKTIYLPIDNLREMINLSSYNTANIRTFLTNIINYFTYGQYKVCTALQNNGIGQGKITCAMKGG